MATLKNFLREIIYPVNSIICNDLPKAEHEFMVQKKNCIAAAKFFKKYISGFPDKWDYSFQFDSYGDGRLLLIHHSHYENKMEDAPLISFKRLCEKIESIGIKLRKEFSEGYGFDAESDIVKHASGQFTIHIRQCQYDKCDIDYVEEVVKKPVLNGICAEVLK